MTVRDMLKLLGRDTDGISEDTLNPVLAYD